MDLTCTISYRGNLTEFVLTHLGLINSLKYVLVRVSSQWSTKHKSENYKLRWLFITKCIVDCAISPVTTWIFNTPLEPKGIIPFGSHLTITIVSQVTIQPVAGYSGSVFKLIPLSNNYINRYSVEVFQ